MLARTLPMVALMAITAELVQGFVPLLSQPPASLRAPLPTRTSLRVHMMSSAAKTSSAREAGLALLLDDGTRKSHSVAENTAFVNGFFKGASCHLCPFLLRKEAPSQRADRPSLDLSYTRGVCRYLRRRYLQDVDHKPLLCLRGPESAVWFLLHAP